MPRTEQFAIGLAVIGASLAVLLKSDLWAYVALLIGFVIICAPYLQDVVWGTERPPRHQIQKMSADEYKERLRDPKFERWVNHLESPNGGRSWELIVPLTVLLILGATFVLQRLKSIDAHLPSEQWFLRGYSPNDGYTLERNGAQIKMHCKSYGQLIERRDGATPVAQVHGQLVWVNLEMLADKEETCSPILLYMHQTTPMIPADDGIVLLFIPPTGPGKDYPNGYVFKFVIAEAK